MSESEYWQIHAGMPKAEVNRIFDTVGTFASGGAGGYSRAYPECTNDGAPVYVEFSDDGTRALTDGFISWKAPQEGDLRLGRGNARRNTFDLSSGRDQGFQRRDHVRAGAGDDYVFMRSDGFKDVIDCGRGHDTVMFLHGRESQDVYRNCERVIPYSP